MKSLITPQNPKFGEFLCPLQTIRNACLHPQKYGLHSSLRRDMGQVLTRHPRRGRRETPYVHFGPQFHCWPACHERHTQTIGLWASDLGELFHDSSPCPNGIDIPVEDPSALCGGKREKDMANSPPAPGFGNPTPPPERIQRFARHPFVDARSRAGCQTPLHHLDYW